MTLGNILFFEYHGKCVQLTKKAQNDSLMQLRKDEASRFIGSSPPPMEIINLVLSAVHKNFAIILSLE